MTIRSATSVPETVLTTDVAIIGGGPAGLTLAASLERECIVIESGDKVTDVRAHHEFHSINAGEPSKIDAVRVRGIGGASLRWTGRCIPLDRYDFERRPWISETAWPVSYEEIDDWSRLAAQFMELPGAERGADCTQELARNDGRFVPAIWRFADHKPDGVLRFGSFLEEAFKGPKRSVLYKAHCTEILSNSREAKAVRVVDRAGRSILVKARHFVVASGCVETCRMLLASQRANPELLSSAAKWLGRGFGQHLRLDAGEIEADPHQLSMLQQSFGILRQSGHTVTESGVALNPDFARANQLGNASIVLRYEPHWGLSPGNWLASAKGRALGQTPRYRNARVLVEIDSEQQVDPGSFITLSDRLDPLGLPRALVNWTINETDCRTAHSAMAAFGSFIGEAGLGQMTPAQGITPAAIDKARRRDSLHQLGGTRMSESASNGVVDANLKVHGTANLSVVGGSVFSTGGHANPTQTIVALAMRLAHHLDGKPDRSITV